MQPTPQALGEAPQKIEQAPKGRKKSGIKGLPHRT
jgi:hypothetical protein